MSRNDVPVSSFEVAACTRGCARELWFGTSGHRLPPGARVDEHRKIPLGHEP